MKKYILTSLVFLVTLVCFGQSYKHQNGHIYIPLKNGIGVSQTVKLSLAKEDYDEIKNSQLFKKNTEKGESVGSFLAFQILRTSFDVNSQIKNHTSLKYIPNAVGSIYFTMEDGIEKIMITYPFKCENGYGNLVSSKTISTIDKDNEITCYVY